MHEPSPLKQVLFFYKIAVIIMFDECSQLRVRSIHIKAT